MRSLLGSVKCLVEITNHDLMYHPFLESLASTPQHCLSTNTEHTDIYIYPRHRLAKCV